MLSSLTLQSFRCYDYKSFIFEHVNIISGQNGCGKTSILEAISLLDGSSGIRGSTITDFIKLKSLAAGIFMKSTNYDISIKIDGTSKTILFDGDIVKSSQASKIFKIVSINNHDTLIFANGKSDMRDLFDRLANFFFIGHEKEISSYKSLASERLKALMMNGDPKWICAIEKQMAQAMCKVCYNRISTINTIAPILVSHNIDMTIIGFCESMLLTEISFTDAELQIQNRLALNRKEDLSTWRTQSGISSVVYDVLLDSQNITFCSAGEQKFCIIMLFIATIIKLNQHNAIFLIDDFPAKLDASKQQYLLEIIKNLQIKSFLTGVIFDLQSTKDYNNIIL